MQNIANMCGSFVSKLLPIIVYVFYNPLYFNQKMSNIFIQFNKRLRFEICIPIVFLYMFIIE